jgi:hypothetical protein
MKKFLPHEDGHFAFFCQHLKGSSPAANHTGKDPQVTILLMACRTSHLTSGQVSGTLPKIFFNDGHRLFSFPV